MRILVIGNMGYVGPALVRHLRRTHPGYELHGFDAGYFGHCLIGSDRLPELDLDLQMVGDVRSLRPDTLRGYDAVIQLAAISNDPMGKQFETPTFEINQDATVRIARAAAAAGVGSFVFASSCSVYGVADGPARREGDPVAPMTAYAKSKIGSERGLAEVEGEMAITCLRFATACGFSPRLRLDLVLNDFVAAALGQGRITVLSDGSPWRPLIDVSDMARAIDWAIHRDTGQGGQFLVVNTGATANNYQVRDLANAVATALPGTEVSINTDAPVDSRSYRVDFGQFERLAPDHVPQMTLADSIQALVAGLRARQATGPSDLIRLRTLQNHISSGRLTPELRWAA
ncbi:NAD-dependent epimerase/dehydratase family protein [Rubellimicrobium roseum]|uniref:SDR family oxidoreductase n=1 Tax=Rubellimicrobium roseum TaxID=687525 RepID=A0A5C4NK29_9RHOB|nr:SDR family oxidoreductase [Rubellimicrobium roseum]TNC73466.1 SDR family oxidoreductase [Rubellimicrobium roseum]